MRISDRWKDYELIDACNGERLERWGDIILIRPDPQIIWTTEVIKVVVAGRYIANYLTSGALITVSLCLILSLWALNTQVFFQNRL